MMPKSCDEDFVDSLVRDYSDSRVDSEVAFLANENERLIALEPVIQRLIEIGMPNAELERQWLRQTHNPKIMRDTLGEAENRDAVQLLREDERERAKDVLIRKIPSRTVNARTILTPGKRAAILVDDSSAYWLVSASYAWFAVRSDDNTRRVKGMIALVWLVRYLSTGNPRDFHRARLSDDAAALEVDSLCTAWLMDMFIWLHEYGHFLLGHFDRIEQFIPDNQLLPGMQIFHGRKQLEIEADLFAFERLVFPSAVPSGLPQGEKRLDLVFGGVFFLMRMFALAEESRSPTHTPTHPAWRSRFIAVRDTYREKVDTSSLESAFDWLDGAIRELAPDVQREGLSVRDIAERFKRNEIHSAPRKDSKPV